MERKTIKKLPAAYHSIAVMLTNLSLSLWTDSRLHEEVVADQVFMPFAHAKKLGTGTIWYT